MRFVTLSFTSTSPFPHNNLSFPTFCVRSSKIHQAAFYILIIQHQVEYLKSKHIRYKLREVYNSSFFLFVREYCTKLFPHPTALETIVKIHQRVALLLLLLRVGDGKKNGKCASNIHYFNYHAFGFDSVEFFFFIIVK